MALQRVRNPLVVLETFTQFGHGGQHRHVLRIKLLEDVLVASDRSLGIFERIRPKGSLAGDQRYLLVGGRRNRRHAPKILHYLLEVRTPLGVLDEPAKHFRILGVGEHELQTRSRPFRIIQLVAKQKRRPLAQLNALRHDLNGFRSLEQEAGQILNASGSGVALLQRGGKCSVARIELGCLLDLRQRTIGVAGPLEVGGLSEVQ